MPLLVHFVEVVALDVKGGTGVAFLRLIFFEQAGQQSLNVVLKEVWVGQDLVLGLAFIEEPVELLEIDAFFANLLPLLLMLLRCVDRLSTGVRLV